MRGIAVGRKNWIHLEHQNSGTKIAVILSVLESCHRLKINPRHYLANVPPGSQINPYATCTTSLLMHEPNIRFSLHKVVALTQTLDHAQRSRYRRYTLVRLNKPNHLLLELECVPRRTTLIPFADCPLRDTFGGGQDQTSRLPYTAPY